MEKGLIAVVEDDDDGFGFGVFFCYVLRISTVELEPCSRSHEPDCCPFTPLFGIRDGRSIGVLFDGSVVIHLGSLDIDNAIKC